MSYNSLHVHQNRLNRNRNNLLLAIPIIIFAFLLAVLAINLEKNRRVANTSQEPNVLGKDAENP